MDVYSAYGVLDKQLLNVANSINVLEEVKEQTKIDYLRVRENPFILTEDSERINKSVVTAHDLNQYKNRIYSISLNEDVHSWLQDLLSIDRR